MPVQSPDFAPRWVLGSLPEDPAEFQRVLAGRLHGLEQWVRAAHARINFTQPFILPPVNLAASFSPPGGLSSITGVKLTFTSAIRATALVLLQLVATATAVRGDIRGNISVNGGTAIAGGPFLNIETANDFASGVAVFGVQLSAATAYTIQAGVNVVAGTWTINTPTSICLIGCPAAYTLP